MTNGGYLEVCADEKELEKNKRKQDMMREEAMLHICQQACDASTFR